MPLIFAGHPALIGLFSSMDCVPSPVRTFESPCGSPMCSQLSLPPSSQKNAAHYNAILFGAEFKEKPESWTGAKPVTQARRVVYPVGSPGWRMFGRHEDYVRHEENVRAPTDGESEFQGLPPGTRSMYDEIVMPPGSMTPNGKHVKGSYVADLFAAEQERRDKLTPQMRREDAACCIDAAAEARAKMVAARAERDKSPASHRMLHETEDGQDHPSPCWYELEYNRMKAELANSHVVPVARGDRHFVEKAKFMGVDTHTLYMEVPGLLDSKSFCPKHDPFERLGVRRFGCNAEASMARGVVYAMKTADKHGQCQLTINDNVYMLTVDDVHDSDLDSTPPSDEDDLPIVAPKAKKHRKKSKKSKKSKK